MRREYPDAPIAGVGAVIVEESRVLLVQRGQEPLKGAWSLPGGALELGESLEEGIAREVLEETGLVVEPVAVVETFDRISRDDTGRVRYHYVLVDFLCRVKGGVLGCATDACDARWVEREDVGVEIELETLTLNVIEKAFSMADDMASRR